MMAKAIVVPMNVVIAAQSILLLSHSTLGWSYNLKQDRKMYIISSITVVVFYLFIFISTMLTRWAITAATGTVTASSTSFIIIRWHSRSWNYKRSSHHYNVCKRCVRTFSHTIRLPKLSSSQPVKESSHSWLAKIHF